MDERTHSISIVEIGYSQFKVLSSHASMFFHCVTICNAKWSHVKKWTILQHEKEGTTQLIEFLLLELPALQSMATWQAKLKAICRVADALLKTVDSTSWNQEVINWLPSNSVTKWLENTQLAPTQSLGHTEKHFHGPSSQPELLLNIQGRPLPILHTYS